MDKHGVGCLAHVKIRLYYKLFRKLTDHSCHMTKFFVSRHLEPCLFSSAAIFGKPDAI